MDRILSDLLRSNVKITRQYSYPGKQSEDKATSKETDDCFTSRLQLTKISVLIATGGEGTDLMVIVLSILFACAKSKLRFPVHPNPMAHEHSFFLSFFLIPAHLVKAESSSHIVQHLSVWLEDRWDGLVPLEEYSPQIQDQIIQQKRVDEFVPPGSDARQIVTDIREYYTTSRIDVNSRFISTYQYFTTEHYSAQILPPVSIYYGYCSAKIFFDTRLSLDLQYCMDKFPAERVYSYRSVARSVISYRENPLRIYESSPNPFYTPEFCSIPYIPLNFSLDLFHALSAS
uniref:Uncharacterized protein n=1 Tax=Oryza sativa subsp. japonica TaxID=39947 RepID=Q5Z4Z0_ORYSJ|nr:hypothetical protein [Oryza sativa Japonica Group]